MPKFFGAIVIAGFTASPTWAGREFIFLGHAAKPSVVTAPFIGALAGRARPYWP